jgi:DEAD/DEAH box helicase domain-containing protein
VRPPAAAIAELAPFNTFYGSSRQVVVQNLDLRQGGTPSQWQLCADCHFMQEVQKLPDPVPATCPACGGEGWGEVGRRRWIAPMAHVRAFARHRDALVGDEREDRERAYYETHNFYDASGSTPSPVWVNPSAGMGFELLPRITLRRLNFGQRNPRASALQMAGRQIPEVSFVVCTECGQVQPPELRPGWEPHWPSCAQRKLPKEKQSYRELHLMRKLETEALRLVVPISEHEWEQRLPNLRSALRLGLRLHFGGDPDFLQVDSYDEPLPGHEGRRRYLVVLDLVPGGTGVLVDLAQNKGANLKRVLELSRAALLACPCNDRGDEVRACHLCLYAYREMQGGDSRERSGHLALDREVAIAELDALLAGFTGLSQAESVGTLRQEQVLESELERRLLARLETVLRERGEGGDFQRLDKGRWRLRVGTRRWLMRAQVDVDETQAEWACRPDWVLYPEGQEAEVLPVALFADGAAYHVQPGRSRSRIEDDLRKRQGLVRPGRFLTWSITWRDLDENETGTIAHSVPCWLPDKLSLERVKQLAANPMLKLEATTAILDRDPLTGLLAHLAEPTKLRALAAVMVVVLLALRGKQLTPGGAAQQHERARRDEVLDLMPPEATAGAEVVLAKMLIGAEAEAMLVVSAPGNALGALHRQPEQATLTLRLEDGAERRRRPQFQTVWRQVLRAYNLLQALPGTVVTSVEQLGEAAAPAVQVYAMPEPLHAEVGEGGAEESASREVEEMLAEIGDAGARGAVRALLRRGAAMPALPYELSEPKRGVIGDIEIGWAREQVGAYLDEQRDTAERLRAKGWTLFPIERGLREDELARALGLREG